VIRIEVILCLLLATPPLASAQTGAYISAGPSGGASIAVSDQLGSTRSIGISVRIPRPSGISFAWDIGSQTSNFHDHTTGVEFTLGTLTVRPVLAGVAFARRSNRFETVFTITSGPAFVGFDVGSAAHGALLDRMGPFEARTRHTIAVFPKLTVFADLNARVGLSFAAGYLIARSHLTLAAASATSRIDITADVIKLNAGVLIKLF
jgi:hypothetical protein